MLVFFPLFFEIANSKNKMKTRKLYGKHGAGEGAGWSDGVGQDAPPACALSLHGSMAAREEKARETSSLSMTTFIGSLMFPL